MHAQAAKSVLCCPDRLYAAVHPYVPQLDFATSAPADELSLAATLQMNVCDPLLVLFPDSHQGSLGFLALIVHANGTVTESSNEDVSFNLI